MGRWMPGVWTYAEFTVCAVAWVPLMAVVRLVSRDDETQRRPGRWMRRFGRVTSRLTPLWDFSVQGEAPADIGRRGYVVVANHESTADPFLLSFLPWDMRWIAKEEIFRLPVIGWMMRLSGDIPLRRGDSESVRDMLAQCRATLRAGMPVMFFPEGTRSREGGVRPFKDGAFQLAIEVGAPILPVALAGTRRCRPKGSMWFGKARAIARVLEPISTAGLGPDDVAGVRELARGRIAEAARDLAAELARLDREPPTLADPGTPPAIGTR